MKVLADNGGRSLKLGLAGGEVTFREGGCDISAPGLRRTVPLRHLRALRLKRWGRLKWALRILMKEEAGAPLPPLPFHTLRPASQFALVGLVSAPGWSGGGARSVHSSGSLMYRPGECSAST